MIPHKTISYKFFFPFVLFWLLLSISGLAQTTPSQELYELNEQRLQINKSAMIVLGSWASINILSGLVLRSNTAGSTRYFHEMNVLWNLVNLGLAAGGIYSSIKGDPAAFDAWQTYHEQQKLEQILLVNGALNVSYILAGVYLKERAKNATKKPERLKGYGNSLLLQGGFLLLFDTAQYWIHHSNATPKLKQLISQISVGSNGIAISFHL